MRNYWIGKDNMRTLAALILIYTLFSFINHSHAAEEKDPWKHVQTKTLCLNGASFAAIKTATKIMTHQIFDNGKAVPCETEEVTRFKEQIEQLDGIKLAQARIIKAYKERVEKQNKDHKKAMLTSVEFWKEKVVQASKGCEKNQ